MSAHLAEPRFEPSRVKAPHGALNLEITWKDGVTHVLPHRIVRGYCPCATCQGHQGTIHFIATSKLLIRDLQRVGNYALEFTFEDGHSGGIYSYRYLRRLGEFHAEYGDRLPDLYPELPR